MTPPDKFIWVVPSKDRLDVRPECFGWFGVCGQIVENFGREPRSGTAGHQRLVQMASVGKSLCRRKVADNTDCCRIGFLVGVFGQAHASVCQALVGIFFGAIAARNAHSHHHLGFNP